MTDASKTRSIGEPPNHFIESRGVRGKVSLIGHVEPRKIELGRSSAPEEVRETIDTAEGDNEMQSFGSFSAVHVPCCLARLHELRQEREKEIGVTSNGHVRRSG